MKVLGPEMDIQTMFNGRQSALDVKSECPNSMLVLNIDWTFRRPVDVLLRFRDNLQ